MKALKLALPALAFAALLPLLQLAACAGPGYYAQAISGHLALMRGQQDIAAMLEAGDEDPALVRELKLAVEIRRFAVERLGLPDNGSYTHFVRTGRNAVTWNVVATPEFSVEPRRWCFLVSGCVPYRGYFKREAAERFASRLREDGLDVTLTPTTAYSTLGWFDDPVLDTMFQYEDEQLASIIFHELAHQQLYVKGDTAFNESYASFVGELGVSLWLQSSGRADRMPAWLDRQKATARFDTLVLQARDRLAVLYTQPVSESLMRDSKAAAFKHLAEDYRELVAGEWQGRDYFAGWFARDLNNARLALFDSYRGGTCAFSALYRAAGGDVAQFHALAARQASLAPTARRAWLDRPCPAVASPGDL